MRGLVVLGLAGAGAYYAYKQGLFPAFEPVAEAGEALFTRAAQILPMDQWDAPDRARAEEVAAIREASGGQVVPILGRDEVVTLNPYEAMLRRNWQHVSPWAKRNVGWAAAICRVENAQMNPALSGDGGRSHGVLQVKVATAETCFRSGYRAFPATEATLKTEVGGIYYGTAEMDRLAGMGRSLEWIIQAYNGGAGWQEMSPRYVSDRGAYLVRVKQAFRALYGQDGGMV